MAIILIRTVLFFVVLTLIIRLTGKRQLGELQVSEFVTALLISEMAALPITDMDIPVSHGLLGICLLGCLETLVSFFAQKSVKIRRMIIGEPIILVANGKILRKALVKARVTLDDIFAEIRIAGYRNIGDIQYVILEQNGKISVLPKASLDRVTPKDMNIKVDETGISHPIIIDGKPCKAFMDSSPATEKQVRDAAKKKKATPEEVLYMTCDDMGNIITVLKGDKK